MSERPHGSARAIRPRPFTPAALALVTGAIALLAAAACRDTTGPDRRFPVLEIRAPIQAMFPGMQDTVRAYTFGDALPVKGAQWSSSDPGVIEAGPGGVLRALALGSATVRVEFADTADSLRIDIVQPPAGQIAFVGFPEFNDTIRIAGNDLWVINADGTGLRQLVNWNVDHIDAGNLSFSPDGCQIVFQGTVVGLGHGLYRVDVGSRLHVRLIEDGAGPPDWAPDGARTAFSLFTRGGFQIFTMRDDALNPDIRQETHLTDSFTAPGLDYYSDSRRIIFDRFVEDSVGRNTDLYRLDLGTGQIDRVFGEPGIAEQDPAISPDGRTIAYDHEPPTGDGQVYVLGPDSVPRQLVPESRVAISKRFPEGGLSGSSNPVFSPDGNWLAFDWSRDNRVISEQEVNGRIEQQINTVSEIYVAGVDGRHPVRLTHFAAAAAPDWGPRCGGP